MLVITLHCLLGAAIQAAAQTPADVPTPIQDNSFLHEEAYNQEPGVMQHISVFTHFWERESWAYGFTQEWPLSGMRHQGSFSLAMVRPGSFVDAGFGDILLNYRFQALGGGAARVSVSPRLSLIVPTGDSKVGRGFGSAGVQMNLPLSVVVSDDLVVHANAGTTLVPRTKNELGERAFTSGFNLSQSFIWLAHPRFNAMLETVWNGLESVTAPGQTEPSNEVFLAPGVRWAHNFRNGLQIVPGLGVAAGVGPSAGERGLIIYLSFEHPFTRSASD